MSDKDMQYEIEEQLEVKKGKYTKGFYVVFALCVCAIGIAGWYTYADVKNYMNNDKAPEISIVSSEPINEQAEAKISGVEKETETPTETEETTEADTIEPQTEPQKYKKVSPVGENKEVLSEFSQDRLVYFETLKDWRLHKGTDYAIEQGKDIYSISDGTVKNILKDDLYGDGIEIEYRNGFNTIYYGVSASDDMAVEKKVKAGDVIGKASEIPCEKNMKSHIHIEITKDNQIINPETYLNSED